MRKGNLVHRHYDTLDMELAFAGFAQKIERAERRKAKKSRPSMRNMCAGCDRFRLCKDTGGAWLCAECAPEKPLKR